LAGGKGEELIVMYEYLYIRIAPRSVDEMFQALRIGVSIADHADDRESWIGALDACHDGDDSAMKGREAVRIQIVRYLSVTAYAYACHQIF
jgi:hypothetical protein